MAAHRQSSYVSVTRALLTAGATLALARVYSGASWIALLFIAAGLPALIMEIGERRRWNGIATVGGTLVVGVWLAIIVDDPSQTFLGIPTASAIAAVGHDLSQAPHVLRSAVVPVDPVGAALMIAVVATFLASLATELIARRLEAPIGAIGPSVALFVALSALGSGRWAPTTALYALVVVEYLVALQHSEMETRRTWFQSVRNRRSQLAVGGAAAGAFVVGLAIVLGPGVPGARSSALIQYRSLGSGKGSSIINVTSPLVSVKAKLNEHDSNTEVFTVKTTEPKGDYWRVIALDKFQDDGWGLNSDQKKASSLPGPTGAPGTTLVTQTFHLDDIDPIWLPAEYRPVKIDVAQSEVLPDSTSLFLDNPLAGLTYTVQSEVSNPGTAELESVSFDDLESKRADVALPANFSPRARQYAQEITANAQTPYDKALALMNVFHQAPFVYDQSVDLGTTANALDKFLFDTHRGFCEQYAAAFAELARSVGLPTRVAVGYQRGTLESDGLWHVAEKDAHAWPEVWLGDTVGWYRFEPTPGRIDPITGKGGAATQPGSGASTTTTVTTAKPTTPTSAVAVPKQPTSGLNVPPPAAPKSSSHTRMHAITVVAIVVAIVLALLLAIVVAVAFAALRRTRRRRHDPDDRRRVLGAWTEAMERLATAGIERRPSTTSLEFRVAASPRARRGRRRSAAHGSRAPAHAGAVLAATAVAERSRRRVGGVRRDRRRVALQRAALSPLARPLADRPAGVAGTPGRQPRAVSRSTNSARSRLNARTSASTSAAT